MSPSLTKKRAVAPTLAAVLLLAFLTAYAQNDIHVDYYTQRSGGDYTHFITQNFEDYFEACSNDNHCQALIFHTTDNSCRLKDSEPVPIVDTSTLDSNPVDIPEDQ